MTQESPSFPPANITIRPLHWTEAAVFSALRKKIENEAPYLPASAGERNEGVLHIWMRLYLHRRRSATLVASENGHMLGYITIVFPMLRKFRNNAYIVLAVDADARGKGIGSKLITAAEEKARSLKRYRIELEVFAKNSRAVALYERLGYVIEGRKKNAIRDESGTDDILFMAKWLS